MPAHGHVALVVIEGHLINPVGDGEDSLDFPYIYNETFVAAKKIVVQLLADRIERFGGCVYAVGSVDNGFFYFLFQ